MSDLGTYSRFKDWLVVLLVGLVISLIGIVAADNRRRIETVETVVQERTALLESYGARLTALEVASSSQREEIARRLSRIEDKIDRLGTP